MNRKLTRVKIMALVMAVAMMLSACSTGSGGASSNISSKSKSTGNETTADKDKPITFDFFYDASWVPTDSWSGIIPQEITKETGVSLKVMKASDSNQLNLLIASGDLPDLIYTGAGTGGSGDKLSNNQYCYSYNELISKYAPTFKPKQAYINIAKSFSSDSNYYTILNYCSFDNDWKNAAIGCPGQACIYYREDMWKALGSPKMETLDDFAKVLGMVKQKYPKLIPYAVDAPAWYFQSIKSWMGISPLTDDGSYTYDTTSSNYLKFLKYANNFARNGYISADNYAINSESDSQQYAFGNKCFSFCWYTGVNNNETLNTNTKKTDPNAHWIALSPLKDSSGKLNQAVRTPMGWMGTFVTKNCKDPSRAVRFIEFMFSQKGRALSMWGREGVDYTLDSKGVPQFSQDWKNTAKDSTEMAKKYNPWFYLGINEVDESYSYYSGGPQGELSAFDKYKQNTINKPAIAVATPPSTSDMGVIKTKLDNLEKSTEAKVIFSKNDSEFTENYNNYMKAMQQTGVNKYNQYMTSKIKEVNSKYTFN